MWEELNIPESFKRFRNEFKLSRNDVANALGIALTSYDFETKGKRDNPTAKTLFRLATTYNVSVDYLLGLTDAPQIANQTVDQIKISRLKKKNSELETEVARLNKQLDGIRKILNSTK